MFINSYLSSFGGVIQDHRTDKEVTDTIGFIIATKATASGQSFYAVPITACGQAQAIVRSLRSNQHLCHIRHAGPAPLKIATGSRVTICSTSSRAKHLHTSATPRPVENYSPHSDLI